MQQSEALSRRKKAARRVLLVGMLVVFAAAVFTLAYSQHTDRGDASAAPAGVSAAMDTGTAADPNRMATTTATKAETRTVVSFRLDPSVTRGLFLGDRWVSPPVFHFAQPGKQYVVQAKLQSVDAQDQYTDLNGNWSTDDPEMIAITRHELGDATVVVRRAGEARVFVAAGGETKALRVKALATADAMDVSISQ